MKYTEKILLKTTKEPRGKNYKTTSFTLLKEDYILFKNVCQSLDRSPSSVLRALVKQLIEDAQ